MSVGDGEIKTALSYIAFGRESTFKTYNTAAAGLDVLSSAFKTTKENKILEEITTTRTYAKRISTSKKIEGSIEAYAYAESTALAYLLQNAFGGTITTSVVSAAVAFTHEFAVGNFDQANSSLCINHRKGDSGSAYVFEYNGVRINEFSIVSEIDEALKMNVGAIVVDSTQTSNDVASVLSTADYQPLSFVNGRISIETSAAAITTTSYWHVQSMELGLANSLKGDAESGRIGSDVLDVLPAGIASFSLNVTMRFNTLTAYNAMINETQLAGAFEFLGDTLTGATTRRGLKFDAPKLYIADGGDPEVSGPDGILTSEVVFHVLRDESSAGGYALKAELTNDVSSY